MTEHKYQAVFLEKTKDFINSLTQAEQGRIAAQIKVMEFGQFEIVHIKTLQRPIKELIIGKYRFVFFIEKHLIYFVYAFIKKTQKTPKQYIQIAQQIYKQIITKREKK